MKRFMSIMMVIVMLIGCCVFSTGTVFAVDGDYTYKTVEGGVEITKYTGFIEVKDGETVNLEIPATLGDLPVVSIGDKAFYQNKSKVNIVIPSGVEYIGTRAFAGSFITGVTMADSVTELGSAAFSECVYLSDVTISNNIKTISNSCFFTCTRLESVVIPEGVEVIEDMAFQTNNHLTSLTLPSTLKSIGEYAFAYTGLTEIEIPEGTEQIHSYAFFICDKLEKATIPGSVKTIGEFAFANCYVLSSLSLGEGIEKIGTSAFDTCALKIVMIPSTVTEIGDYAFGYVFDDSSFDYKLIDMFQILCTKDSAGNTYASSNDIPYMIYTITPPETSEPTEPTEPSVPTDPTEPTDPSIPSEPSVPTEPSEPTENTTQSSSSDSQPGTSETTEPSTSPSYNKGDANMDGSVNIKDATAIQKHIALLEILSENAKLLADYDEDTVITIKDATAIQKFIAGIVA